MESIILLIGRSGAGKTTIANMLHEKYGLKILDSYTTRPRRFDDEGGHLFVSKQEFDSLQDKCAYTIYDGYEYCATTKQVDESDIYVIDAAGLDYFKAHYNGSKRIYVVFLTIDLDTAIQRMKKRGDNEEAIIRRLSKDNEGIKINFDIWFTTTIMKPEAIAKIIWEHVNLEKNKGGKNDY